MKRNILNPHWVNNARTVIVATFVYEDGRNFEATLSTSDSNNSDLVEILANFTTDEIEQNTQKNIKKIKQEQEQTTAKQQAEKERFIQEKLFAAKLEIFEIEAVKNSTNRTLKSYIRRSKSATEAQAWAAALLLNEFNSKVGETPTE